MHAFRKGFRGYFQDRDLALREATGGEYMAEVRHHIDFQFNYRLKGRCRVEIEGEGVTIFSSARRTARSSKSWRPELSTRSTPESLRLP